MYYGSNQARLKFMVFGLDLCLARFVCIAAVDGEGDVDGCGKGGGEGEGFFKKINLGRKIISDSLDWGDSRPRVSFSMYKTKLYKLITIRLIIIFEYRCTAFT